MQLSSRIQIFLVLLKRKPCLGKENPPTIPFCNILRTQQQSRSPPFWNRSRQYCATYCTTALWIASFSSIKDRFQQPSFEVYEKMELLLLKSVESWDDTAEIIYVQENYDGVIDFTAFTATKADTSELCLQNVTRCFSKISSPFVKLYLLLILNTLIILNLLLVNPATNVTAERSFSLARRVKTRLRSTASAERFNSLPILHIHKTLTDNYYLRDVANDSVSKWDSGREHVYITCNILYYTWTWVAGTFFIFCMV